MIRRDEMKRSAIVLAAGHGTRMKSRKPKILHEILGKSMVLWVTDTIKTAGISDLTLIVGYQHERVQGALLDEGLSFVYQEKQEGTGHAVLLGANSLKDLEDFDTVLVACGDTPLLTKESLEALIQRHESQNQVMTVLTARVDNPYGYGRILLDNGSVCGIVEEKDATDKEREINLINTGTYCFKGSFLKDYLPRLKNDNAQGEYYLTDLLAMAVEAGYRVGEYTLEDNREGLGVNNRLQLSVATELMQRRIVEKHMLNGVSFTNPNYVYIEPEVVLEEDVLIEGGVSLLGKTVIKKGTVIESGSRVIDGVVGEDSVIKSSMLWSCEVGNGCYIGPFAYLRPNTILKDYVKIGDFVEVKNSTVGQGTKIPHLSYVGDSTLGERINIGCGSITCNYDGRKKHRTVIEDDVFIGSNTNLVAPLTIREGAVIGAGSTITKDIDSGILALTRAPLKIVKSWKKK